MDLTCTIDKVDGDLRIRLVGDIDIDSVDELRDLLQATIRRPGTDGLRVDLLAVTFLDSSAISVLVDASKVAEVEGCRFLITRPRGVVRKVLEVTGVLEALVPPD